MPQPIPNPVQEQMCGWLTRTRPRIKNQTAIGKAAPPACLFLLRVRGAQTEVQASVQGLVILRVP